MGNLLARWRLLELDHCSMVPRLAAHQRLAARARANSNPHAVLVFLLWSSLGHWRSYLRFDHALSRSLTRYGGRAWIVRCLRHFGSTNLQRRFPKPGSGNEVGASDPGRYFCLPGGDRDGRPRWRLQRTDDVSRTAKEGD